MTAFKVMYVRWTLTQDISPPRLWNCILCSLTVAVPLFTGPTLQEFKQHFENSAYLLDGVACIFCALGSDSWFHTSLTSCTGSRKPHCIIP